MSTRATLAALVLLAVAVCTAAIRVDRRVVDVAEVGNADSEAAHGFAGELLETGRIDGAPHVATGAWMHFALTTFDDTEVTVELTLVNPASSARSFDLIVEDSVVATRTVSPRVSSPVVVPFAVPFARTKGKAHVIVIVRARDGLTPGVRRLRTIQDHYEVFEADLSPSPFGVAR